MASQALQGFRRTVTITWPANAKEDARKALVRIAKAGHQKIMAEQQVRSGYAPDFDFYANYQGNRNLDSVVLPGPIVYNYRYFREILDAALKLLRDASPVQSGLYRDSHTLYLNGAPITGSVPNIRAEDEIFVSNPVPYSRRLEVGRTKSGAPFVKQVGPNIYERVRQKLIARFGKVASFSLIYITVPNAHVISGGLSSHYLGKGNVRRKRRQKVGAAVQSPAIMIAMKT